MALQAVKKVKSLYMDDELVRRVELYAEKSQRSFTAAVCYLLGESLPELAGAELRAVRKSLRTATTQAAPAPSAPTSCPSCGDEVFFRTLRDAKWRCDACDQEGTY